MKLLNGLIKWFVTLTLALSAGLLVIIFLSSKPEIGTLLLRIIILFAIGFTVGIITRILFKGFPASFQIISSLFTNLIAILSIDHFYRTPFQFKFVDNAFHFFLPSISDITQFIFINLVSLAPLLFFRKSTQKSQKLKKSSQIKKKRISLKQKFQPVFAKVDPQKWMFWKKFKIKSKRKKLANTSKAQKPALHISHPKVAPAVNQPLLIKKSSTVKTKSKISKQAKKLSKSIKADVKLVGEEEHVCPYCLDEVAKNDSRGVIICPECGTWHHEDCWNLTGSCGVAHRNEL